MAAPQNQTWEVLTQEIVACRRCPRLVNWREEVARVRRRAYRDQEYWGKAVPGFGDPEARIHIVGLAPGAHGANRTGRVFTGDGSGAFLFRALHRAGFANQPYSVHRDDGLAIKDVFISAVCRCVPPNNRPDPDEIEACLPFLREEITLLKAQGIVVLGKIAFDHTLRLYRQMGYDLPKFIFGHGMVHSLGPGLPWLIASYHPSLQNTQTGKLTEAMFDEVWEKARTLLR